MKRILIVVLAVLTIGVGMLFYIARGITQVVDPSFATSATLEYDYDHKSVIVKVSNDDLKALKEILRGRSLIDSADSHTENVSIKLTDGRKSLTFYPARGVPYYNISETGSELQISKQQKKRLDKILAKYGKVE